MYRRGIIVSAVFILVAAMAVMVSCQTATAPPVAIAIKGADTPQTQFAVSEIADRTSAYGYVIAGEGEWTIAFRGVDGSLGEQSYRISVEGQTISITGGDQAGLMYGGLEVGEQIALYGVEGVASSEGRPYILNRGVKFNIPLDMRTPSYSDAGDSAQANIDDMWDIEFWHEYIDELARNRYNAISIWNLNPFPSMVKVPEYPDIALDDVWRSTIPFDESYNGTATNMVRDEHWQESGHEVVRKITIDEKIEFWREVMRYASDRGMKFYIYTWNIYTYGEQGKYGITDDMDNETTIDYYRCAAREMVRTYPDLAGLGVTAGENMVWTGAGDENEMWLWNSYGRGLTEALNEDTDREFSLLHRLHLGEFDTILDIWKDFPGNIDFSDKYSIAHMYSYPHPNFIDENLEVLPKDRRLYLEVRNDDMFNLKWGDVDYVREYLSGMPSQDVINGFFMGSDGYVTGRESTYKDPELSGQLFIKKHWINFMLIGRLAYDINVESRRFADILTEHFGGRDGNLIQQTMISAGKTIPLYNRLVWFNGDTWYPEGNFSDPDTYGYYTANNMLRNKASQPGSGVLSISESVKARISGEQVSGTSAFEIADQLRECGQETLDLVKQLEAEKKPRGASAETEKEFSILVKDQKAFGYLALYYAEKINGALMLRLYNDTSDASYQQKAVESYTGALDYWREYAVIYTSLYEDELLSRVGFISVGNLEDDVAGDIDIASKWKIRPLQ